MPRTPINRRSIELARNAAKLIEQFGSIQIVRRNTGIYRCLPEYVKEPDSTLVGVYQYGATVDDICDDIRATLTEETHG
jgi:predicted SpoU family rRNA methylase